MRPVALSPAGISRARVTPTRDLVRRLSLTPGLSDGQICKMPEGLSEFQRVSRIARRGRPAIANYEPAHVPRVASAEFRRPACCMAWLIAALQLLFQYWADTGRTRCSTPTTRCVSCEVRAFLAGQGWFDLHEARVAAADRLRIPLVAPDRCRARRRVPVFQPVSPTTHSPNG